MEKQRRFGVAAPLEKPILKFLTDLQLAGLLYLGAAIGVLAAAVLMAWTGGVAGFQAGGLLALACICWGVDNYLTALIDGITPA